MQVDDFILQTFTILIHVETINKTKEESGIVLIVQLLLFVNAGFSLLMIATSLCSATFILITMPPVRGHYVVCILFTYLVHYYITLPIPPRHTGHLWVDLILSLVVL